MNIRFASIFVFSILLIVSISIGLYRLDSNQASETQASGKVQNVKPEVSAQMAYIDPETGKLSSENKGPGISFSTIIDPRSPQKPNEPVQVHRADGSVSVDTSNYNRNQLQATIDCNNKVQYSHTDKNSKLPIKISCEETANAKD